MNLPADQFSIYKVIVIGDDDVGKTSLIRRYATGDMNSIPSDTPIGAMPDPVFHPKIVALGENHVKLVIWDMGDQARFAEIRAQFYKGAHAAALVYDVTSPSSFLNLMHWRDELQSNVPLIPTIVVGNKHDLVSIVPPEEVRGWTTGLGMKFVAASAKNGEGVGDLFLDLAHLSVLEEQRRTERQRVIRRYAHS